MTSVTFRALLAASMLLACIPGAQARAILYDRLGGEAGVTAIASDLVDRASTDPATAAQFKDSNLTRVKTKLAELLCQLSGGPCHYSGDDMKATHAGHHVSQAQFYDVVDNLRTVLKARHVSLGATNELLKLLASMKRDIVEPPAPSTAKR